MQEPKLELSTLLALRDGEPVAAQALPAAADMAEAEQTVERLRGLQSALRDMPDLEVDDSVWQSLNPPREKHAVWFRYPLSTAASVLVVSALAVLGVVGGVRDLLTAPNSAVVQTSPALVSPLASSHLVSLIDRSQDLERLAYDSQGWRAGGGALQISPLGELLLIQLAQVDAQISESQFDDGQTQDMATPAGTALWQQRVDLLQAFIAEMETQNPERFEDSRSM